MSKSFLIIVILVFLSGCSRRVLVVDEESKLIVTAKVNWMGQSIMGESTVDSNGSIRLSRIGVDAIVISALGYIDHTIGKRDVVPRVIVLAKSK